MMIDDLKLNTHKGILSADQCQSICERKSITQKALMIELLPIAASYSISQISHFRVGAVAQGGNKNSSGYANLYLGSNIEYGSLYTSLHAEQAAVSNAWLEGETQLSALAVSKAPCGHCRQFLYEVVGSSGDLELIAPPQSANAFFKLSVGDDHHFAHCILSTLLPSAFGPKDLGSDGLMLDASAKSFTFKEGTTNEKDSEPVNRALMALNSSYAPYSQNYAGCSIELHSRDIYSGRYAENAAFNPSLSPFSAALSKVVFHEKEFSSDDIKSVVLIETTSVVSQKLMTEQLLAECSPKVNLDYFLLNDYLPSNNLPSH